MSIDKPRMRQLEVIPLDRDGEEMYLLRDGQGITEPQLLPRSLGPLLSLLDGRRTGDEIIETYTGWVGEPLEASALDKLVAELDKNLLLDSPRFRRHLEIVTATFNEASVRPAALAGSAYPAEAVELRRLLDGLYRQAAALETPDAQSVRQTMGRVRGCIVPHIDFGRGGSVEALAYTPLLHEHFDVLVILGIAHCGLRYPFSLAPKDFETALGTAVHDRAFCEALQQRLGPRLTAEQWAHKTEHSVEFVTTFLQHSEMLRQARIVPIICGGFFDEISSGESPATNPDMATFCTALREVTAETESQGRRVGFVVSVDGAHIGTQFGDDTPLTPQRLKQIEAADREFWRCVEDGDMNAMHAHIARDNNARNVDAHPAVYALFHAFPDLRARLLCYQQAHTRKQNIVVTFASLELFEPAAA